MAISFYFDHHVPRPIAVGLRVRSVDVLTAYEDGSATLGDPELLDRADQLGRVLFTHDDDLLAEAVTRQRKGISFTGVIYAHQLFVSIGRCISELEVIGKAGEPSDTMNTIIFLPL
jgi:hypothetical protein